MKAKESRESRAVDADPANNPISMDQDTQRDMPPCPYPSPIRHITTHNANSEAVFSTAMPTQMEGHPMAQMTFYNCFTTEACAHLPSESQAESQLQPASQAQHHATPSVPTKTLARSISTSSDVSAYARYNYPVMKNLGQPHGSVFRILDFAPGSIAPLHRTRTLDYAFVLEGAVEAVLDSGETRRMERGSVLVQRGTMHAWREATGEKWARVGFVLLGFGNDSISRGGDTEMAGGGPADAAEADPVAATSRNGDGTGWKEKYDRRNDGDVLREWVPWEEGMPPSEMAKEVSEAASGQRAGM